VYSFVSTQNLEYTCESIVLGSLPPKEQKAVNISLRPLTSGGTDTDSRQGMPCSLTLARRPMTAPYAPVHRFLSSWNFTASACVPW